MEGGGHRRWSEFESAGADWNVRGCRHRNAKIWDKKGRFCKNLAKTEGLQLRRPLGGGGGANNFHSALFRSSLFEENGKFYK